MFGKGGIVTANATWEDFKMLFEKWQRPDNHWEEKGCGFAPNDQQGRFVPDGIVDFDEYWKTKIKILFVLKDAHDEVKNGDYTEKGICDEVLQGDGIGRTWNPIAEWIRALLYGDEKFVEARKLQQEKTSVVGEKDGCRKYFKKVAIMDVKKASGKGNVEYRKLLPYAKWQKEFIKDEIALIKPDIIIACSKDIYQLLTENIFDTTIDKGLNQIQLHEKMKNYGHYFDAKDFLNMDKSVYVVEYHHPNMCTTHGTRKEHYENMLKIRKTLLEK